MNFSRLRIAAAATTALVLGAACSDERSTTAEPVGDLGFGVNLLKQATNLPRGRFVITGNTPVAPATGNDSIYVELAGLDSLSTAQYVVWIGNDSATKFSRVTGNLTIARIDTAINNAGDRVPTGAVTNVGTVSGFSNGRSNYTLRLASTRTASGLAATDSANLVLISIESSASATTPGDRRIMWARRNQGAAATGTADTFTIGGILRRVAPFRFGNFAPRPANEFVYAQSAVQRFTFPTLTTINNAIATATTTIIPRGRIEKRGSILTVNDSNYYRPPIGYYYEAFAVRTDTLNRLIDTVSLGQKATPYPDRLSFYEADRTIVDPRYMFGTPTPVIVASQHRANADTIPAARAGAGGIPWRDFTTVNVTLQNKAAPPDRMGAVIIMGNSTPGSISGR